MHATTIGPSCLTRRDSDPYQRSSKVEVGDHLRSRSAQAHAHGEHLDPSTNTVVAVPEWVRFAVESASVAYKPVMLACSEVAGWHRLTASFTGQPGPEHRQQGIAHFAAIPRAPPNVVVRRRVDNWLSCHDGSSGFANIR